MKKLYLALLSSTFFFLSVHAQNEKQVLNQKLSEAKNSFAIVQSTVADTTISFKRITLFRHPIVISNKDYDSHAFKIPRLIPDKYYDAFVFKTIQGGYLYWSFQMDTTYVGAWYMLKYDSSRSADSVHSDSMNVQIGARTKGSKNINYFTDFSYVSKPLKETSLFTMGQGSALKLEPNSEYIVWFESKTKDLPAEGVPTIVSVNILEDNRTSVKEFFAKYFNLDN